MKNFYSKNVTEPYAIEVLSKYVDQKYLSYYSPKDTDNFDYLSPNNQDALEVSIVIPENEIEAYKYLIEYNRGKQSLDSSHIKGSVTDSDGRLLRFIGASPFNIMQAVNSRIDRKVRKAQRRNRDHQYNTIELCLLIKDGGLLDTLSFDLYLAPPECNAFENIFFITQSQLFVYNKQKLLSIP